MNESSNSNSCPQGAPVTDAGAASYDEFVTKEGEWRPLITFGGNGLDFFVLKLQNAILSILTLGIYHFWGKARVRAYLWKETTVFADPLEYTGTGKELFISFLIVMPVFFVLMAVMGGLSRILPGVGELIFFILFLFLWQYASYRALRYRLTRSRWRGIRCNLAGNASGYAWKAFGYTLLSIVSLGLLIPFSVSRTISLKMNNVSFGNRRLVFEGTAGSLYRSVMGPFIAILIVCLGLIGFVAVFIWTREYVGLGRGYNPYLMGDTILFIGLFYGGAFLIFIMSCYLQAAAFRWFFRSLRFGRMRAESVLTGGKLLRVSLVNMLLVIFTLGIGLPWAQMRMYRAVYNSIDYTGDPQIGSLFQNEGRAPKFGEGLLEALDVDVAF